MKEKRFTWLVIGIIGLGLGYAWLFRHVEDDAFITFRYSQHLAQGIGPVWNADQRVEGYSNFLWMLLMAVPIALGCDPVLPATLLSLGFLAANLWVCARIALRLASDSQFALWIWLPVACSHTLLLFATSGLETASNGFLWSLTLLILIDVFDEKIASHRLRWRLLGLVVGLAVLSRPEGGLLFIFAFFVLIYGHFRLRRMTIGSWISAGLPLFLLILPWLAWKWHFYGGLLPNTFYIKSQSVSIWTGLKYVGTFLAASGAWIPELMCWFTKAPKPNPFRRFEIAATYLVLFFVAYTLIIGGDYLEFRLLTPVIPMVLMLPVSRLLQLTDSKWQFLISVIGMCVLAFVWGQGNGRFFKVGQMNSLVHEVDPSTHTMSFAAQGKALGTLLEHDSSIRLAIGACGAIPYYTEFYGIDLYGLNEASDAFSSYATGYGPGHSRLGDYAFLQSRRPHLISLRCDYLPSLAADRRYTLQDIQVKQVLHGNGLFALQSQPKIIELPLGNDFVEVCMYVSPHPRLESLCKNKSLKIYTLEEK